MSTEFEDEHLDVLHNIESALAACYRASNSMTDYEARAAVDALIRAYQAELKGRPAPVVRLNDDAQMARDAVFAMCEWRIGRQPAPGMPADGALMLAGGDVTSIEDIVACLKRIRKSIDRWHKEGGRRGYFDFVSNFV